MRDAVIELIKLRLKEYLRIAQLNCVLVLLGHVDDKMIQCIHMN